MGSSPEAKEKGERRQGGSQLGR
jgi:hypothetical protein